MAKSELNQEFRNRLKNNLIITRKTIEELRSGAKYVSEFTYPETLEINKYLHINVKKNLRYLLSIEKNILKALGEFKETKKIESNQAIIKRKKLLEEHLRRLEELRRKRDLCGLCNDKAVIEIYRYGCFLKLCSKHSKLSPSKKLSFLKRLRNNQITMKGGKNI